MTSNFGDILLWENGFRSTVLGKYQQMLHENFFSKFLKYHFLVFFILANFVSLKFNSAAMVTGGNSVEWNGPEVHYLRQLM